VDQYLQKLVEEITTKTDTRLLFREEGVHAYNRGREGGQGGQGGALLLLRGAELGEQVLVTVQGGVEREDVWQDLHSHDTPRGAQRDGRGASP